MRSLLFFLVVLAALLQTSDGRLRFSEAGHVANKQGWIAFLKTNADATTLKIVNVDSMVHASVELSEPAAYPVIFENFIFLPYIDGRYEVYSFDARLLASGRLPNVGTFGGAEVISTLGRMAIIAIKPPAAEGQPFKSELLIVDVNEKNLKVFKRQEIDRYGAMSYFRGKIFVFGDQGPLAVPIEAR